MEENILSNVAISGNLKVVLHNHSLWLMFYREQTEMILSKPGRRMFPFLAFKIYGMDPNVYYRVFLEIVPVDDHYWRFHGREWCRCEKSEKNIPESQLCIHPDSPNTGAHWMGQEIKFEKLKMTNNKAFSQKGNQMILLQSFHKYQPRLGIEEVRDDGEKSLTHNFTFQETEFIAVTAYQNNKISELKISHNPFAKGFRESYYPEGSVKMCFASIESAAMTTSSPKTDNGGYLLEPGKDACQAKEEAPLNPGLWVQASQPLLDYSYDSTPNSSSSSSSSSSNNNLLSLGMYEMQHGFLPFTSSPTNYHSPKENAVVPQGDWLLSSLLNSNENNGGWFQSISPVPRDTVTKAEEVNQLEKEPWIYSLTSGSNDSGIEGPKKRCLSSDHSGDEMCSGRKHRKQDTRPLASLEFCATTISPENASSDYTAGLGDGAGQVMDEMLLTPGFFPLASQESVYYSCDSIHGSSTLLPFSMNALDPGLTPFISQPTMPFDSRQDAVDPAGGGSTFFSANSNMNNLS